MDMVFQTRFIFTLLDFVGKDRHVAGPRLEEFLDDFEHGDHGGHIAVRSEVGAPFAVDGACLEDTWKWFVGHTYAGVGLAVLEQHVITRFVFFDEAVLQQEGVLLCLHHGIGDVANLAHQHLGLETVHLPMEVGGHTALQVLGFAHINDDTILIPVLVATGLFGHVVHDVFKPVPDFLFVCHVTSLLHLDEGGDFYLVAKDLAAVETFVDQLNEEVHIGLLGMELIDEVEGGLHRSSSGKEVVMEQHDVVGGDGILMDFDGVGSILFGVGLLYSLGRQLTGFAAEDDTSAQSNSEGGCHHKTATLYTHDFRDALVLVNLIKFIHHNLQALCVLEKGGDVPEIDTLNREVRNTAEILQ